MGSFAAGGSGLKTQIGSYQHDGNIGQHWAAVQDRRNPLVFKF